MRNALNEDRHAEYKNEDVSVTIKEQRGSIYFIE